MANFIKYLVGPRLLRIYGAQGNEGRNYNPGPAEKLGDQLVQLARTSYWIGIYASPIILWFFFKKDLSFVTLFRLTVLCSSLYACSLTIRAIGRLQSPEYGAFFNVLESAKSNFNPQTKNSLLRYDSEFWAWPVDFSWTSVADEYKKPRISIEHRGKRSIVDWARAVPCQIVASAVANSVGVRLLYPGTILQNFIGQALVDGRSTLINRHGAIRYKLEAKDGNFIDTVVIDRRGKSQFPNGDILVICCEGNAGFYEVGMAGTPIEAGYSVLGWNHPGFGGSSGLPFPSQEEHAIDIVVQFAWHSLNFPPERIVLYGWSIGGFTASWAAMNYPNIRAVVLDATFDHVLPLAQNVMPPSLKPIVSATIRSHFNLSVAEQICKYPGPILLVRRTQDEVIALEPGGLSTNRGNDLLFKLLKFRFPNIIDEESREAVLEWMGTEPPNHSEVLTKYNVQEEDCSRRLSTYIKENSNSFPMSIGQNYSELEKIRMALYLARKYMIDFDSTHCIPLPVSLFRSPRELGLESETVTLSEEEAKDIKYSNL